METAVASGLFKIGDAVPRTGMYLCVPCGYVQRFEEGSAFATCDACLAGTENGPEGYRSAEAEFWQLIG